MEIKPPHPLSVILIWIVAIFLAFREGVERWPAASEALPAVTAGWLSFVPLVLLVIAAGISVTRSSQQAKPAPAATASSTSSEYYARSNAIDGLKQASKNATRILKLNKMDEAERGLPELRASLLTAYKQFSLPRMPKAVDAMAEHYLARRLIERTLPYLEEKHDEEAREAAQEVIDEIKAHGKLLA